MMLPTLAFLNIDLDLQSSQPLTALIQELGEKVVVLRDDTEDGVYYFSCELSLCTADPSTLLWDYVALIKGLSPAAQAEWQQCHHRVLDLGYSSGAEPSYLQTHLAAELLQAIITAGASLALTFYATPPNP